MAVTLLETINSGIGDVVIRAVAQLAVGVVAHGPEAASRTPETGCGYLLRQPSPPFALRLLDIERRY